MMMLSILFQVFVVSSVIFFFSKKETELRRIFWAGLIVKIVAGIALGLLYTFYYAGGDTFVYFEDGIRLGQFGLVQPKAYISFLWSGESNGSIPFLQIQDVRAQHFTKIISVLFFLGFRNYWMLSILLSLFSFAGAWFLIKTIRKFLPHTFPAAVFAFLFFPSIVFWSSGVLRESLSMGCLFYLSAIVLKIWFTDKVKVLQWILVALACWTLWILKYYFAAIFIGVAITTVIFRLMRGKIPSKSFAIDLGLWFSIFIIPAALISASLPNLYPQRVLQVIVENYRSYPDSTKSIVFDTLQPDFISFLVSAPKAIFSGLFRPLPWEVSSLLEVLSSIENVFTLTLVIAASMYIRHLNRSSLRVLIFALIFYVVLLTVFITLSTPNFGTLSRYRVGYLPFLVYLACLAQPALSILQRILTRLVRLKA